MSRKRGAAATAAAAAGSGTLDAWAGVAASATKKAKLDSTAWEEHGTLIYKRYGDTKAGAKMAAFDFVRRAVQNPQEYSTVVLGSPRAFLPSIRPTRTTPWSRRRAATPLPATPATGSTGIRRPC